MCGIAGIFEKTAPRADEAAIRAMTDAVAHRGPDGSGTFLHGRLALGHRRLAIIDLGESGHQPMHYGDGALTGHGALTLVFNGEIYNYLELKSELERAGYAFRSRTDSEVILAAYARWGEECVNRFNGMWAFALFDRARNSVFCSRDRFGVKPFYYIDTPGRFAFGSEIRQLLPLLGKRAADRERLLDFVMTGMADHTTGTFFTGVSKLPAGHNLVFSLADSRFAIRPFYRLGVDEAARRLGREQAVEQFRESLSDAVRLRLRSDVPVGTCLSGGVDSSSVATLAAPLYSAQAGRPFCAITAVSEEEATNEARYAEQVARHSAMSWLTVRPTYGDFVETLPAVVRAQEEPFGSTSLTMQYCVMRTARAHGIPVLLDGQGGDETLLGYNKYYAAAILTALRRRGVRAALRSVRDARRNNAGMGLRATAKYLIGSTLAPLRWQYYLRRHDYLRSSPAMPSWIRDYAKAARDEFTVQAMEIGATNLPVLLRYEDKNSMAHAVETRLPFLDYRVLEMALSLPIDYKIHEGWTKWVLRAGMAGRMPDEIVWRRNKLGFESPERLWLAQHRAPMRAAVLASPQLGEICVPRKLEARFDALDARARWRLYSVALWEREFAVGG